MQWIYIWNFGLVSSGRVHGGHSFSYAENQATMSHRKRGEATCSQPASSRLIFLFPLMLPWEPCQLPLWKQLLIALAQIRTSSTVPSKTTLQCCSGILDRVTQKNSHSSPFQTGFLQIDSLGKTNLMTCLVLVLGLKAWGLH